MAKQARIYPRLFSFFCVRILEMERRPSHKEQIFKISGISLDQENPRFPPSNSQREAIEAMLRDQGDKIVKLAQDIFLFGLNPSVKLILFKDGSRFIDGDGNRRLTALKILETPSLADSFPKIRKKIDTLVKKAGVVPTEVGCVVFRNREETRHWIEINHGGEQEGRGQINWNPEQKDRFERKPSIGLEALDLLVHGGLVTTDDKAQVNKSTLDRLLSFKEVKSELAISKNGGHYRFGNIEDLKKVVLNLRGSKVDEVYTAEKGKKFLQDAISVRESGDFGPDKSGSANLGKSDTESSVNGKRSPRTKTPSISVFGGNLSLKSGHVNNLYRDVDSIYSFYQAEKERLSKDFIVIFRMSLRLLAETAAKEVNANLSEYLKDNFDDAKRSLDSNGKTTLSSQSVNKNMIVQLLQTGAHDYDSSKNEEQAVALSIILGAILAITHRKNP